MKKFSKEKLHLPKIDGITLRWLINIIGVIVVFFIIVFNQYQYRKELIYEYEAQ